MDVDEFVKLADKAAWKLIFPPEIPYKARMEHGTWRPWVRPSESALDSFITGLIADGDTRRRARGIRLKSRAELASQPHSVICPYYHVRRSIFHALRQARMWVEFVNTHHAYTPFRMAKLNRTRDLANAIKSYLKDGIDTHTLHPFSDYSGQCDPDDQHKRAEAHRKIREILDNAHSELRNHAKQIQKDLERGSVHGNKRHGAWKGAFAAELGYCWTTLTGERPTLSSTKDNRDFPTFVAKAFESIGGDPREKWIRTIRDVLHGRPLPDNLPRPFSAAD